MFMFNITTAPSGYPQDVSIDTTSSQSAVISWNPPLLEERNGIITSYSITIHRQGTDSQRQLTSLTTMISVSMLSPFTTYTVTVAASTTIDVGPPSTQLTFRTDEDGEIRYQIVKVCKKSGIWVYTCTVVANEIAIHVGHISRY